MKIEFSRNEVKALFDLIDIAVKSAGVSVAASAAFLAKKLDDAAKAEDAAPAETHAAPE